MLADRGTSRERDLLDGRVGTQYVTQLGGVGGCEDVEDAFREACHLCELWGERNPASKPRLTLARANAESGVSGGALTTTVQPAASAADALRVTIAEGKFQGVINPTTPMGCLIVMFRTPSMAEGIVSP